MKLTRIKSNLNRSKCLQRNNTFTLISASIAFMSAGTLFTWPSPAIPKLLLPPYNITIDQASYLTVIPPLAMIVGTPLFCILLDKIGRKKNLIIMGCINIVAWLLIAFANNIYIFYLSRAITGLGDACGFATLPAYIAESATPVVRGLYGNMMMIIMFFGQFLVNCIGYYCPIRTTAFIMLTIPILFLIIFYFMPETPYFYIMKNDEENARKSLQKLRRIKDVEMELKQITADVQRQMSESSNYSDLWKIKSNRMAIFVANIARIIQQFGGISALVVYTQYIFEQAGGNLSSGVSAMIFTGMLAGANIFANFISDKLGRKSSMVVSSLFCGIALLSETIFFYLQDNTDIDVSVAGWFPVVGLAVYVLSFVCGLGVVPTLLLGELFSTGIRSKAAMVTNIVFAVALSALNKLFQYLLTSFGLWIPFLFFTICLFIGSIVSFFIIPDTKGKTLEEIQQMLKGNKK
ncbi:facilitated trehalose transporter tret1-2 -like protein [Holotrichia oblita]|uniref:Facilitated trehalose transporter tret1-2 -like protein n=1 Tax=Holotrichia oblita TaxID=644536 RepID=A0ACB9TPP0_HOLOL|nr:facilitated trehalose transporter tret1-2 -like protein [Holotrichia oblita]